MLAEWAGRAVTVTAGATKFTFLFVFDVLVFLTLTGGTVAVKSGLAVGTFTHKFIVILKLRF